MSTLPWTSIDGRTLPDRCPMWIVERRNLKMPEIPKKVFRNDYDIMKLIGFLRRMKVCK